ncbi:acyl-CoA N-acyltransferase [Mycena alexandri]|uniref:Acyl-CoA N-acyltransferase n=1 Tax=Mycena alexandri TaxID=1745969 RepID=A0AAD6WYD0_9AGAR|nr:acyl-CoA N-acyltransferase [Mycena alexandri]
MILEETLACISARVSLVPPSESDDTHFAALRCHPETRRYLPFVPDHCSPQEARELRTSRAPDRTRIDFSIYVETPGSPPKYAGAVGILNINETFNACEAGISIVPEHFRGGIATEALYGLLRYAFEERKFHRVVFHTAITKVQYSDAGLAGAVWGSNGGNSQRKPDGRQRWLYRCLRLWHS